MVVGLQHLRQLGLEQERQLELLGRLEQLRLGQQELLEQQRLEQQQQQREFLGLR